MTRASCQENASQWVERADLAVNASNRRAPGEASTYKHDPSSAMESKSGVCEISPDGRHNWKFGKCSYCQKGEGQFSKGPGAMANPGGVNECPKGGKCMFKFARCTKCGRGEQGITGGPRSA